MGIVDNHPDEQSRPSRTSATSLISSCCSRESFLQSREPDPEQVLLGLGFGGSSSVSAIPQRFLTAPSRARGVCVETFKRQTNIFQKENVSNVLTTAQSTKHDSRIPRASI